MGIPLFYKHVITQHPDIITESKQKIHVNNLLFDLNCAIHPCCAGKTSENEMFSAISIPEFCEFFVNKRDFPLLRKDRNHPYIRMYGLKKIEQTCNFSPILSMVSHKDYDDIPIPTWYDWEQCLLKKNWQKWDKKKEYGNI